MTFAVLSPEIAAQTGGHIPDLEPWPRPHAQEHGGPPTTRLRAATLEDVRALEALIDASVRSLSKDLYTPAQIDSALVHVLGVDTQLIADGTYYIVGADAAIVAAGGWSSRRTLYGGDRSKQGEDPLLDPAVDAARIRAFYVHPEWTRRGLARLIFSACEASARERGFRRFELVATLPGVPFYRALGFGETGPVDVQLADGLVLPCVRMERAAASDATP